MKDFPRAVLIGDMNNMSDPATLTAVDIARRWGFQSPSSILRVMKRFGISGTKFGKARQAARRFAASDVRLVERLAGGNPGQQAAHQR